MYTVQFTENLRYLKLYLTDVVEEKSYKNVGLKITFTKIHRQESTGKYRFSEIFERFLQE